MILMAEFFYMIWLQQAGSRDCLGGSVRCSAVWLQWLDGSLTTLSSAVHDLSTVFETLTHENASSLYCWSLTVKFSSLAL